MWVWDRMCCFKSYLPPQHHHLCVWLWGKDKDLKKNGKCMKRMDVVWGCDDDVWPQSHSSSTTLNTKCGRWWRTWMIWEGVCMFGRHEKRGLTQEGCDDCGEGRERVGEKETKVMWCGTSWTWQMGMWRTKQKGVLEMWSGELEEWEQGDDDVWTVCVEWEMRVFDDGIDVMCGREGLIWEWYEEVWMGGEVIGVWWRLRMKKGEFWGWMRVMVWKMKRRRLIEWWGLVLIDDIGQTSNDVGVIDGGREEEKSWLFRDCVRWDCNHHTRKCLNIRHSNTLTHTDSCWSWWRWLLELLLWETHRVCFVCVWRVIKKRTSHKHVGMRNEWDGNGLHHDTVGKHIQDSLQSFVCFIMMNWLSVNTCKNTHHTRGT